MKGCSSTKSGILWDTTKSMKLHHIEPASWHFPRSLIVRAMRGQSATRSPSKQMVMIFRAATKHNAKKKKSLTRKKQWKQSYLIQIQVYANVLLLLCWYELNLNLYLFTFYKSKNLGYERNQELYLAYSSFRYNTVRLKVTFLIGAIPLGCNNIVIF